MLIISWPKGVVTKPFLAIAMINTAITFFIAFQYMIGNHELYAILHPLGVMSVLCIYPSFYMYVLLLTGQRTIRYQLFIAPLLFGITCLALFYGLLSHHERIYFLSEYRVNPKYHNTSLSLNMVFRYVNLAYLMIQIIWFSLKINTHLTNYHHVLEKALSNVERFKLNHIRSINLVLIVSSLACVSFYLLNPVKLFGSNEVLLYPFYLLALVIIVLGTAGITHQEAPAVFTYDDALNLEDKASETDTRIDLHQIFTKAETTIVEEQLFLEPDLNVIKLSRMIGTNRTYLSNSINQHTGLNFSQYINKKRIDDAKTNIKDNPHLTINEIALKSGFGSVSGLIRAFRDFENTTPNKYKETLIQNDVLVN